MKNIYSIGLIAFLMALGGCAVGPVRTTNGSVNNAYKLAKDNSGITYGPAIAMTAYDGVTIENACDTIKNNDARCAYQTDYKIINVPSEVGFYAGVTVVLTLLPKDMDIVLCDGKVPCSFLKVHSEKGKFGTILEVASGPGEMKCYWSGFGKAGSGTVCPAYNWDYRKDLRDFDSASMFTGNGEMKISD